MKENMERMFCKEIKALGQKECDFFVSVIFLHVWCGPNVKWRKGIVAEPSDMETADVKLSLIKQIIYVHCKWNLEHTGILNEF